MIRRGFWVAVGAAGGIMGYRRVTALGRQLSASLGPATPPAQADHATPPAAQQSRPARALGRKARRGLVRGTIRLTRDTRMFSRDVRDGMDEYLVRHRTTGSPTLGAGARSRRPVAPSPLAEAPGAHTATDEYERVKDDR